MEGLGINVGRADTDVGGTQVLDRGFGMEGSVFFSFFFESYIGERDLEKQARRISLKP